MFNLLIIDDEQDLLEITKEKIESNFTEIKIVGANSVFEAIHLTQKHNIFDLIVCDYNMPEVNGAEFLKYLIATENKSYFLLYTSDISPRLPNNTNNNFLGVVQKFDFEELFRNINACLQNNFKSQP